MLRDHTPATAGPPQAGLLAGYRAAGPAYDEMVSADGRLRDHWSHIGRVLDQLGPAELARRADQATRLLRDDGVTYTVYGGYDGAVRPPRRWALDPVPVVLSSGEWADIEHGVIQRAELLNLVLADLYGPRELLRRGLLPPEAVLGHPGFLRECDQIRIPGTQQLLTCAVDLARDHSGQCWVWADRTQAPSGAGYALENRVVVSRVFPSMYRDAQVHRLAPFFRSLRSALQAAAPAAADDARIVVLTPGPWSETAFEHAFLASILGYPLVEGDDLTVREGRVWLRSLGRLEPVDVILRRVDSWCCDPLELVPDSQLGVPGLIEACRLGTVSVVNTLGSGALENPALPAFLPRLSRQLLGRPLRLPSVPTWWCGEETGRQHVLANLDRLTLTRISQPEAPLAGWRLCAAERDEARRRIEARPHEWVGQEQAAMATVPTLAGHGLEARRAVLRTFLVARHESYAAMPGALARVADAQDSVAVSNQAGALSKDTWVLASEPEHLSGFWLHEGPAVAAVPPRGSMSSRAAENLFWLGRYAERAEAVVRLLRVVFDRRNDFERGATPAGSACLRLLLEATTHVTTTYPGFAGESPDLDGELTSLVFDDQRPGTLAHAVRHLLEAVYAVRDQLSIDTWLVVGALDRALLESGLAHMAPRTLAQVMQSLLALEGLGSESMVRDPGWRLMDAGRRLERGIQLCALLRATVTVQRDTATDSLLLESVLTAAESIITYRRRYRSHAQLETLLDLLLLDPGNPRSLAYQVDRLSEDVDAVTEQHGPGQLTQAERLVLKTSTALRLANTTLLGTPTGPSGDCAELGRFLTRMILLLERTADALDAAHFTHLPPQRSLAC